MADYYSSEKASLACTITEIAFFLNEPFYRHNPIVLIRELLKTDNWYTSGILTDWSLKRIKNRTTPNQQKRFRCYAKRHQVEMEQLIVNSLMTCQHCMQLRTLSFENFVFSSLTDGNSDVNRLKNCIDKFFKNHLPIMSTSQFEVDKDLIDVEIRRQQGIFMPSLIIEKPPIEGSEEDVKFELLAANRFLRPASN